MGHLSVDPPPRDAVSIGGDVFKALADPSRRLLLDALFEADGQSLAELSSRLPSMTRFGVMKHLRLLEAANLISTRKIGREKLHYLNPVPIRLIHDRWIGKYAEPWVGVLADLKSELEAPPSAPLRHVFRVYIRAAPERVWQAITDPDSTLQYFNQSRVESTWRDGERVVYWIDGQRAVEGRVLQADPPRKLVTSWAFRRNPRLRRDPPSRVSWEIEPVGPEVTRLTVIHDGFPRPTATFTSVGSGWPVVLSSLKSFLETGAGLAVHQDPPPRLSEAEQDI